MEQFPKEKMEMYIRWAEDIFSLHKEHQKFWDLIKIPLETWKTTIDHTEEEFWVVGITRKRVVYYNHVEEGFNFASFTEYGYFKYEGFNQTELHDFVIYLFNELLKR